MKGILLHVSRFKPTGRIHGRMAERQVKRKVMGVLNFLEHKETVASAYRRQNLCLIQWISDEQPEDITRSTPYSYQYIR
jgi:hypothetical protein